MKVRARNIVELLAQGRDYDPDDEVRVRWAYEVSVTFWPAFVDYIMQVEAAGVTVTREHRGGLFNRRGWITLDGRWGTVSRCLRAYAEMSTF